MEIKIRTALQWALVVGGLAFILTVLAGCSVISGSIAAPLVSYAVEKTDCVISNTLTMSRNMKTKPVVMETFRMEVLTSGEMMFIRTDGLMAQGERFNHLFEAWKACRATCHTMDLMAEKHLAENGEEE